MSDSGKPDIVNADEIIDIVHVSRTQGRSSPVQLPIVSLTPASDPRPTSEPDDDNVSQASSKRSTRASTRGKSPVALPPDLHLKVQSQVERLQSLKDFSVDIHANRTRDSGEVKAVLQTAEEIHKAFVKTHAYFEDRWPSTHYDHSYFVDKVYHQETSVICDVRRIAATKLQANEPVAPVNQQSREATSPFARLPKLALPQFEGNYQTWPSFCDLFTSMVMDNQTLTDLERLHYLKVSVIGPASELIAHVPLTANAFPSAWQALKERYGNKRLLIDTQLAKILHEHSATERQRESADFLHQLINGVVSANNALTLIGETNKWESMVVHHTVKQFSTKTRELWEASVSKTDTYPTFHQLKSFAQERSRTLEQTESSRPATSSPARPTAAAALRSAPTRSSHVATSRPGTTAQSRQSSAVHQFVCDCCPDRHFILSCPVFRDMSAENRKEVVMQRRLCQNCLGRHNAVNCKTTTRCKSCNAMHHSMMHDALTKKDLPAPTCKIAPRPFTTSHTSGSQPARP